MICMLAAALGPLAQVLAITPALAALPAVPSTAAAPPADPHATEQWAPIPPVVRPAPETAPTPPPSDAIVLFGGKDLSEWVATDDAGPARWKVEGAVLTIVKSAGNIQTRRTFTDYQLHLEWRTPKGITGTGQARGNSGIFLGATGPRDAGYELQILDSFANPTYVNGQAGAVYKQHAPLANPARAPGAWQTYDIAWTAPRFAADGMLASPARVTALLNGVLVQNDFALAGETVYIGPPSYRPHGPLPIKLQAHRDPSPPISFRNIWIRPLP